MLQTRFAAVLVILAGIGLGYFVYTTQVNPESPYHFRLGLDLTGGTHLVYQADVSEIPAQEVPQAMDSLREVIERRVNLFGVAEPLVQVEESSALAQGGVQQRLIIELPGVTDVQEAIRQIGETPLLEFKLVDPASTSTPNYITTGLTGRFVENAKLEFGGTQGGVGVGNEPIVLVNFNEEGKAMFGEITRNHVGEQLAIFLDGELISDPVINEAIEGGSATISGGFAMEEAKKLSQDLSFGALPVPIELASTQSIGASLGSETVSKGVYAGLIGLGALGLFLILWYRLPGLVSVVSLLIYVVIMLAIFKAMHVTLTAAGIAGLILSIGMAVDANVLIFERLKEELALGKKLEQAIRDGFSRAWLPIRDSNFTGLLSGVILFWFGTSIVEGFALMLMIGIFVSMLTALTITRTLLLSVAFTESDRLTKILFGNGLK